MRVRSTRVLGSIAATMRALEVRAMTPTGGPVQQEATIERLLEDARKAAEEDDFDRAEALLMRAAELDPASVRVWINLSAVRGELGREEDAEAAIMRALAIDPRSREARSNLGVLRREAGRLDEAEQLFRSVLTKEPEFVSGHYNLAHTLFLAGRFKGAARAYRLGLKLDPAKTPNQNARLAWSLLGDGQVDAARLELRRALSRLPPTEMDALCAEADEVLGGLQATKPGLAPAIDRFRRTIDAHRRRAESPPEEPAAIG